MATKENLINPDDIIFDDNDTMPMPETDEYKQEEPKDNLQNKILKPSAKFLKLFEECIGQLPYNMILTNSNNEKIKLTSLFDFVDAKQTGMTVADMNAIIAFIAPIEYKIVKPLMSIIDDSKRQSELWTFE